jgi:hypothetical protein
VARQSLKKVIPLILETREDANEAHIVAREPITVNV